MLTKFKKQLILALGIIIGFSCYGMTTHAANLSNEVFNVSYYYENNPDLQAAFGYDEAALLNHYLTFGLKEGRSGSAEFNACIYKNNYSDLNNAFGNDYLSYCKHYMNFGKKECRNASNNISGSTQTTTSAASSSKVAAPANAPVATSTASNVVAASVNGTVLGSYSTNYDATIPRATNISVAASRINGVVIQPNESFSFSQTILPRTSANGYVSAPVIINKKMSSGLGGGICQVSSTLYAAMLSANIPATERYPHSLSVSYIPKGMDATISGTAKDLKFTNTTNSPIVITASTNGGNGTLTVSLIQQNN